MGTPIELVDRLENPRQPTEWQIEHHIRWITTCLKTMPDMSPAMKTLLELSAEMIVALKVRAASACPNRD